jgi:integrase
MAHQPYCVTVVRREWGTGSVYPVNGRWRVGVSLGSDPFGKRRRKVWQYATQERAEAKLREVAGRLDRGLPAEASRMTLAAYVPTWLEAIGYQVKPHTLATYRGLADHLDDLGPYRLAGIGAADVRRLLHARLGEGYSTRTVLGILDVLRRVLRMAVEDGYLERNVAQSVKGPRLIQAEPVHFTAEQARLFLEAARGDRLYALYATALGTGLRRGELLALTWRDVDVERRTINVRRAKTAAGVRTVYMAPFVAGAIAALPKAPGPLFLVSPSHASRHIAVICRRANLAPVGFHALRHSAASILLAEGVLPLVIQHILGHSRAAMTARYARSEEAQLREALDKLGRAVA